ncbi:hypothetical protein CSKR_102982 [Clonorchis sinensis]|uniref:Uncharacterized protein n=1 Tax=Clonorchis sinensis TaxID=79923 RepID=A0A3R7FRT8_CLOSI|nr:hypothetical protein CSKR_102982 [Clonorchis sinensis]
MCRTKPPHVPVATIFEISRYMHTRNALLIRLLKILPQPTTGFARCSTFSCLETSKTGDSAGFQIGQADALSGLLENRSPDSDDSVIAQISAEPEKRYTLMEAIKVTPIAFAMIHRSTRQDPLLSHV